MMTRNIPRIVAYLEAQSKASSISSELETSYDVKIVPLGSLRLKLVEFLFHLLKLKKDLLLTALAESNFFGHLSYLIEAYPWNNFLQLKSIQVFEEIFESENKDLSQKALTSSNIG